MLSLPYLVCAVMKMEHDKKINIRRINADHLIADLNIRNTKFIHPAMK